MPKQQVILKATRANTVTGVVCVELDPVETIGDVQDDRKDYNIKPKSQKDLPGEA